MIGNGMAPDRMPRHPFDHAPTTLTDRSSHTTANGMSAVAACGHPVILLEPRQACVGAVCADSGHDKTRNAGTTGALTLGGFRTDDDLTFALEDQCPHQNGLLSQGIVDDSCVTRSLRNRVISLESGALPGADDGRTTAFPVRLVGRDFYLSLQPGA